MVNTKIEVYTDGGSRGNPGPAASAFAVYKANSLFFKSAAFLGVKTNNFAEYTAVENAVKWLLENNYQKLEVIFFLDSELVVKQLNGIYKIKNSDLAVKFRSIKRLEKNFSSKLKYNFIPRTDNI